MFFVSAPFFLVLYFHCQMGPSFSGTTAFFAEKEEPIWVICGVAVSYCSWKSPTLKRSPPPTNNDYSCDIFPKCMMTSSNGNIFRVTGHLCGHGSPVNSPHKGQWRGALMFSLICTWINGWVNNREADGLRRHPSHYDITVRVYQ